MKKTTIILFSLALVLIISGAVLCFVGTKSGDVFDSTVIADEPITHDIGDNVKSIVVNLEEVTVNVYGGSHRSYIETVNVNDKFIKSKSSTELNISDKTSLIDIVVDTVQNFTGLRNLFFREQVNNGAKIVNVYISDSVDLTQFTVYAERGTVNIQDMNSITTYTIEVGKATDNITLSNINTGSNIHLSIGDGSVSAKDLNAVKLEAALTSGNFYFTPISSPEYGYNYDLATDNGSIYINEDDSLSTKNGSKSTYHSTLSAEELAEKNEQFAGKYELTDLIVKVGTGSINVKGQDITLDQKDE